MIYERIPPDDPIREPTIVSMGLLSMKPSAQSAHPEYEFNTVIATGISAEPILFVMFHPKADEHAVVLISDISPIAYDGLVVIAISPRALIAPSGLLRSSLKGRSYPFFNYPDKAP